MKYIVSIMSGILLSFSIAVACDDHVGKCQVDAWRHAFNSRINIITLQGSSTCNRGLIQIRFYDAGKFIGVTNAFIGCHAFETFLMDIHKEPKSLNIKYSIEPEN